MPPPPSGFRPLSDRPRALVQRAPGGAKMALEADKFLDELKFSVPPVEPFVPLEPFLSSQPFEWSNPCGAMRA